MKHQDQGGVDVRMHSFSFPNTEVCNIPYKRQLAVDRKDATKKCCICGTVTNSSWRKADNLAHVVAAVFGPEAAGRSGYLCGACRMKCQGATGRSTLPRLSLAQDLGHRDLQVGKRKRRFVIPPRLPISDLDEEVS